MGTNQVLDLIDQQRTSGQSAQAQRQQEVSSIAQSGSATLQLTAEKALQQQAINEHTLNAQLQAQEASQELASAFGGNLADPTTSIIGQLGQVFRSATLDSIAMKKDIQELDSQSFVSNPIAWLGNQFKADALEEEAAGLDDQANTVAARMSQLNSIVTSGAQAQAAISDKITAESIAASLESDKLTASLQQETIKKENAAFNLSAIDALERGDLNAIDLEVKRLSVLASEQTRKQSFEANARAWEAHEDRTGDKAAVLRVAMERSEDSGYYKKASGKLKAVKFEESREFKSARAEPLEGNFKASEQYKKAKEAFVLNKATRLKQLYVEEARYKLAKTSGSVAALQRELKEEHASLEAANVSAVKLGLAAMLAPDAIPEGQAGVQRMKLLGATKEGKALIAAALQASIAKDTFGVVSFGSSPASSLTQMLAVNSQLQGTMYEPLQRYLQESRDSLFAIDSTTNKPLISPSSSKSAIENIHNIKVVQDSTLWQLNAETVGSLTSAPKLATVASWGEVKGTPFFEHVITPLLASGSGDASFPAMEKAGFDAIEAKTITEADWVQGIAAIYKNTTRYNSMTLLSVAHIPEQRTYNVPVKLFGKTRSLDMSDESIVRWYQSVKPASDVLGSQPIGVVTKAIFPEIFNPPK